MEAAMAAARSKPKAKAKAKPRTTARKPASRTSTARKWSQRVTETSNAMTLERDVFKLDDPKEIAASLTRSAERSHRRKSAPYRSAMSMLTFYVNRAGHNLSARRKRILERAKDELRKAFDKG
jgi:hypothetical protein